MSRVAAKLWAEAVKDVRASVGGRCKKVDISDLEAWSTSKEIHEFATQLKDRKHECCGWKKSSWKTIVNALHRHAQAFDVFVQQQPVVACIAWGICRLLIQVAAHEVQFNDSVAEALTTFVRNLDRYLLEARLFAASQRVLAAIQQLFFQTLLLIVHYRAHLNQSRVKRVLKVGLVSSIDDVVNALRNAANHLDRELITAGHQAQKGEAEQQARYRKESSAALHDIKSLAIRIEDEVVKITLCFPEGVFFARLHQHDASALHQEFFRIFMHDSSDFLLDGFVEHPKLFTGTPPNAGLTPPIDRTSARNVRSWLGAGLFDPGDVADPEPGTCDSLMINPVWRKWSSGCRGTLVIVGDTGCGKSVYAKFLASRMSCGDRPLVTHFFKTIGHKYGDAKYLAVSILSQLWSTVVKTSDESQLARLVAEFQPVLNTWLDVRDCPFDTLLRLAKQLLSCVQQVTVIVDALDECSTNATDIGAFLIELGQHSGTQVIVTTRHLLPLARLQGNTAYSWVQLALDKSIVQPDIELFVKHVISCHSKLRGLQQEVFESITKQAEGNFLAAHLFIATAKSAWSRNHLKTLLLSLRKMFPDQYQQLLEQSTARLLPDDRARRDDIFRLLLATKTLMKATTISQLRALDLSNGQFDDGDIEYDPDGEITRLCQPFVRISAEHTVEFVHGSAKMFLLETYVIITDADLFLARKCLAILNEAQYADPKTSADLLRKHFLEDEKGAGTAHTILPHSDLYAYAALYFQDHVTAVSNPPDDLVQSLRTFLLGPQFVAWSEAVLDLRGQVGLAVHIGVYNDLKKWSAGLPEDIRRTLPIEHFFEAPHLTVCRLLRDGDFERALQYLPLLRIGDYFNEGGQSVNDWQKAYENKQSAVTGLSEIYGPENRLVLRFTAEVIREYFWQKRFPEALSQSIGLAELQRRVVGENKPDLYFTLWLVGAAYLSLSGFDQMKDVYAEATAGLGRLVGTSAYLYLYIQLYEGNRLERVKQDAQARELYEDIIKKLQPIVGKRHPFLTMAQTAAGSVLRKMKSYSEAEINLIEALGGRNKVYSLGNNVLVDTTLQLALLYRDMGNRTQCLETLKAVEGSSVYDNDFERRCSMRHIRALSDFDQGEYDEPKTSLLNLVDEATGTNRYRNNRELLWVRLTLAAVMRLQGEADEALMLFSELVEPDGESLADEPEPPAQLRVAEEALVFVREAKLAQAGDLLQSNGLRWVRERDFDILAQGGPVVDTAEIAPIKLD